MGCYLIMITPSWIIRFFNKEIEYIVRDLNIYKHFNNIIAM